MIIFNGCANIPDDHPLTTRWKLACRERNIFVAESRDAQQILRQVLADAHYQTPWQAEQARLTPAEREDERQMRLLDIVIAQNRAWAGVAEALDLYHTGMHQPRLID